MWKDSIRNIVVIFQPNILRSVGFYVRHSANIMYFFPNNCRLVKEWKYMKKLQGPAIPIIHCLLRRHDLEYNFLVMEKLDQEDLEKKFQNSNRDFSMKTLLMLADQMIENIEIIHEEGLLHNDLKPNNMSMGTDANNCSQLYLIDFGMCQSYREKNGKHVDYQGFYSLIFY